MYIDVKLLKNKCFNNTYSTSSNNLEHLITCTDKDRRNVTLPRSLDGNQLV